MTGKSEQVLSLLTHVRGTKWIILRRRVRESRAKTKNLLQNFIFRSFVFVLKVIYTKLSL